MPVTPPSRPTVLTFHDVPSSFHDVPSSFHNVPLPFHYVPLSCPGAVLQSRTRTWVRRFARHARLARSVWTLLALQLQ